MSLLAAAEHTSYAERSFKELSASLVGQEREFKAG